MKTSSFHPGDYSRGRKHGLELDVGHSGIQLPILLVRGSHEGAALVVTAGIHGDEYEGVRAIFDVVETLDPAAMRGDLIAVPVSNPPAFWAGTRRSPLDGVNLARIFPRRSRSRAVRCDRAHAGPASDRASRLLPGPA